MVTSSLPTARLQPAAPTPTDALAILAINATAAIAWGTEHHLGTPILARPYDNVASQNVALTVGLRRDHGMDDEGEDGQDLAYANRSLTTASSVMRLGASGRSSR